jgi:hypothetical protein
MIRCCSLADLVFRFCGNAMTLLGMTDTYTSTRGETGNSFTAECTGKPRPRG